MSPETTARIINDEGLGAIAVHKFKAATNSHHYNVYAQSAETKLSKKCG
ncbi:hypothetical protein HNR31_001561 [Anoxybacillus caldiproteolyticus]|uniref:Uncharacterized protein n=1 Tax=Thermaerobacillus caldiproteolyticus TaxID=247480 RepID=A0A7V9Z681_9BACL|nr:hypothetical protein [Anoxybacillus caldiproteolyticus]